MVSRILVDGFKSIDRAELDLGMFTLLSGVNSAGKSSIIQAFLYMVQMQKQHTQKETDSEYVVLGKFADIRNHVKGNKEILFEMDVKKGTTTSALVMRLVSGDSFTAAAQMLRSEEGVNDYVSAHNVVYLSADRIGVKKAYDLNIEKPREIGNHGEYAYSFLGMYGQEPIPESAFAYDSETVGMSLNNQVNYWLDYLLGFHIFPPQPMPS